MHELVMTRRSMVMGASALVCCGSLASSKSVASGSHAFAIGAAMHQHARSAVPSQVAERVGWTLLDALAVMHFGTKVSRKAPFLDAVGGRRAPSMATVPTLSLQLAPENAAAANAYLIHAAEIDDSDLRGQLRASAVVFPTLLAAAELVDATGEEFVRALALGYTLQGRFTAPLKAPIQSRGWMASGVWGPPAAAAAAALLMKLSPLQIASAIGLAGSASGGLFQYFFDQSEEKRLIMARAARTAIESARLAKLGEVGPARIIEGQAGLYALFAGEAAPQPSTFTRDLGDMEGPLFIHPKFFAASHSIIPSLDGIAADLPGSFAWQNLASFVVSGDQGWAATIGSKVNNYVAPENELGAMLNFSFVVAMYLVRGSALPFDYAEAMRDMRIHAIARGGSFEVQPGADLSIELRMKSGATHLVRARTPGPRDRAPLDADRRMRKVASLTTDLTTKRRDALVALCHSAGAAPSMRAWVRTVSALFHH